MKLLLLSLITATALLPAPAAGEARPPEPGPGEQPPYWGERDALLPEEIALVEAALHGERQGFAERLDALCRSGRREWEEALVCAAMLGGDALIFRTVVRHPRHLTQCRQRWTLLRPLASASRPGATYLLRELLAADPAPDGIEDILDQLYDAPDLSGFALHQDKRAVIATLLLRAHGAPCRPDTLERLRIERENVLRECPLLRHVLDGSYTPLPADCSDAELLRVMACALGTREQLCRLFSRVDTERRFRTPPSDKAAGRTPLLYAAGTRNWLMVETFLLLGANADATDAEGRGLFEQTQDARSLRFLHDMLSPFSS